MKKVLILLCAALSLQAQSITWTKQTGASAPNPPYFVPWDLMQYNPVTHSIMLWAPDNAAINIFSNSLWNFQITDPTSATGVTLQKLGTDGAHAGNVASFSRDDWPGARQFNAGIWWDSRRNAYIAFDGVQNQGHGATAAASDMWQYAPRYPLQTNNEHWQRLNPANFPNQGQYWLAGAYDPDHDLDMATGWGTSSAAPMFYYPTELNANPGTLTATQLTTCPTITGGCIADGWVQPPISSFICKNSPSDTGVACNNINNDAHQIPQAQALTYQEWEPTTHKMVFVSQASPITLFSSVRTWTYDPPTKTYTEVTSLSTPPPLYLYRSNQHPMMYINPNDGKFYFHQKEGFQINISAHGSGYMPGTYAVGWTGSCAALPAAHYTVDGTGIIVSTSLNASDYNTMPTPDCVTAGLTPTAVSGCSGCSQATLSITWIAPHLWTLTPNTWVWTDLGVQSGNGPASPQYFALDPAQNAVLSLEFAGNGSANLWVGKISGSRPPTITAPTIPAATNGVAYSKQLTAAGPGSITWSATGLPAWATLDASGLLHGTPNAVASTAFTATATNGTAPDATQSYTLVVAPATLSIAVSVQEALFNGDKTGHTTLAVGGITRTNDSFCTGIPIPDSAQIEAGQWNWLGLSGSDAGLTTLGMTGATAAQFRVLGVWPDGYAKWVQACGVLANLTGGSTATVTLTNTGSGNTGGSNLATENNSTGTILVNTGSGSCGTSGAYCFTFNKSRHAGIDKVQIDTSTLIQTGSGQAGFVVSGPTPNTSTTDTVYPANVTCGTGSGQSPCTTLFSSANDSYSSCLLEVNGPVETVIKCLASHLNSTAAALPYMRTIVRYYLRKNHTYVRMVVSLWNADMVSQIASNSGISTDNIQFGITPRFATAFKGFSSYELRMVPNLAAGGMTGALSYTFPNATTAGGCGAAAQPDCTTTGTVPSDNAYLYEAQSNYLRDTDSNNWCPSGAGCIPLTNDTGYAIIASSAPVLLSSSLSAAPSGWADMSDGSGHGIQMGVYEMAAYWPKSLEMLSGGADLRIGILPRESSTPYYQAWPQSQTYELFLNFHSSAPASLTNEFLKFQHPLIGRASVAAFNAANVLPWGLLDGTSEDNYYKNTVVATQTNPSPSGNIAVTAITNTNPMKLTLASSAGLHLYQDIVLNGFPGSCVNSSGPLSGVQQIVAINGNQITVSQTNNNASSCVYSGSGASIAVRQPVSNNQVCCIQDVGTANTGTWPLIADRYWYYPGTGGPNQQDFRYTFLTQFLNRGMTGRFLHAKQHFTFFQNDMAFPRSLGFKWSQRPHFGVTRTEPDCPSNSCTGELDRYGNPNGQIASGGASWSNANRTGLTVGGGMRNWISDDASAWEHQHWYGAMLYYWLTGEETVHDYIVNGPKAFFLDTNTADYWHNPGSGNINARSMGSHLTGAARLYEFLNATLDPDAKAVATNVESTYASYVKGPMCASGYPGGCTGNTPLDGGPWTTFGVNPVRGIYWTDGTTGAGGLWCGVPHNYRTHKPFMMGILVQGLTEFAQQAGPAWSEYWQAVSNVRGMTQAMLSEMYLNDSTSRWDTNGLTYQAALEAENGCTAPGEVAVVGDFFNRSNVNMQWPLFSAKWFVEGGAPDTQKYGVELLNYASSLGTGGSDLDSAPMNAATYMAVNPTTATLKDIGLSSFTNNGGGSYALSWFVPAGLQPLYGTSRYYWLKWSPLTIVDSIGYNAFTGTFTGNPALNAPWFSANILTPPAPLSAGTQQTLTVNGLSSSTLTAANFSLKAVYTGTLQIAVPSHLPTTVGAAYSLQMAASGGTPPYVNYVKQSGTFPTGLTLNSATGLLSGTVGGSPGTFTFTVSVTDSAGSPVTVTSASSAIVVNTAVSITTASPLTAATNKSTYSQAFSATGGIAPYTFAVTSGSLPTGLVLSPGGVLSGTPTSVRMKFQFTVTATDFQGTVSAAKAFTMDVGPQFTFGSSPGAPANCSTAAGYPTLDLPLCTITGEYPLGTFPVPAVGSSFIDQNFGTPITVLSKYTGGTTGSVHGYFSPTPWSATGKYALISRPFGAGSTVIDAVTGVTIRAGVPASVTSDTATWDNFDDNYFYHWVGVVLKKYNVLTGVDTNVKDLSATIDPRTGSFYTFTSAQNGGNGDHSKDNWKAFYTDVTSHNACVINLTTTDVYCFDYRITRNGRTPIEVSDPAANGCIYISRGVDSVSNKRYVVVLTAPWVIASVGTPGSGVLNFEELGPEVPHNVYTQANPGNDNNVCEGTETCLNNQHNDMIEGPDGQQYVLSKGEQDGGGVGDSARILFVYNRLNAGLCMARTPDEPASTGCPLGAGGRIDMMLYMPAGTWFDGHLGCAKMAGVCVWAGDRDAAYPTPPGNSGGFGSTRSHTDQTTVVPHLPRESIMYAIKGIGEEVRALLYTRSVRYDDDNYWSYPRPGVSNDGTKVMFDSNLGYANGPQNENVLTAPTGFSNSIPVIATTSIPNGVVNQAYSPVTMAASSGTPPYTWSIVSGSLPTGLVISSPGVITGTPTLSGTFTPTVKVTDSLSQTAQQAYSIVIGCAIASTSPLQTASLQVMYSQTLAAPGCAAPVTWTLLSGTLPSGLTLATNGVITGTPSLLGTYNFTVRATDAGGLTADLAGQISVVNGFVINGNVYVNGSIIMKTN